MISLIKLLSENMEAEAVAALFEVLNGECYGCCADCPRDQDKLVAHFRKAFRLRLQLADAVQIAHVTKAEDE